MLIACPACESPIWLTTPPFPGFVFDELMVHIGIECRKIPWRIPIDSLEQTLVAKRFDGELLIAAQINDAWDCMPAELAA